MKRTLACVIWILAACSVGFSQEPKTRNIIIITLDGYRWQELFKGADRRILNNSRYIHDQSVKGQYWDSTEYARRERLMPFFWNVLGAQGQLYGNRKFRNRVNCSNTHLLSYPGYSEMLVGFPSRKVSSNDRKVNPNPTVLEFIQGHRHFKDEVAAFTTWDVFPYILRADKADLYVNAGTAPAAGNISEKEKLLNLELATMQKRPDQFTFQYALEFLKRERPRVMFIGFDETDHYAHHGAYDQYLNAAHQADQMIGELWQWIQSQPDYKDQTTFLITTDHGRGKGKNTWKNHRLLAPGSGQIWFGVIGPDTPAFGEMKMKTKYFQKQVAKTIAAFLGLDYKHSQPVGEVVQTMLAVPALPDENSVSASESRNQK